MRVSKFTFILLLLLIPFLLGYTRQSSKESSDTQPSGTLSPRDKKIMKHGVPVEVISEPAGARIEFNNDFMCVAPCTFYVLRKKDWLGYYPWATIVATPPYGAGMCVQSKTLSGDMDTPRRIYFQMNVCNPGPVQQPNVNILVPLH